jgi:hypothetical protein
MAKLPYIAARNFLSLNGTPIILHAFEGGVISAEIVKDILDSDLAVRKHLASLNYSDFIFEIGPSREIIELIKKAWDAENLLLACSLLIADGNFKVEYEEIFSDSLVKEITIPQCDVASKEAAFFRLRIKPALIRNQKGDGRDVRPKGRIVQKQMMKSNFRFELGKLPCSRVATVDSFSVVVNGTNDSGGNKEFVNRTANAIDFPNLFLTILPADLTEWMEWHQRFVIDGKNSQSDELSGRLVFLSPNLSDELLSITLQGVGIFSLEHHTAQVDKISRFLVGLYCQRMVIES